MAGLSQLWRRAAWWRASLCASIVFTILTFVFPADWMQPYLPWASRQDKAAHVDDADLQGQNSLPPEPTLVEAEGSISFAGHRMPLPAGRWHELISGRIGADGTEEVIALVRIDRNIVTGVIMIASQAQPTTRAALDASFSLCDGTGNYASHLVAASEANGAPECWFLAPSRTFNRTDAVDFPNIIRAQLDARDLPYPPIFLRAQWIHAEPEGPNTYLPTAVTVFLAPNEPGTLRLIAPKASWNVRSFARDANVKRFVDQTSQWFGNWVGILRGAVHSGPEGADAPPVEAGRDPAAPT